MRIEEDHHGGLRWRDMLRQVKKEKKKILQEVTRGRPEC